MWYGKMKLSQTVREFPVSLPLFIFLWLSDSTCTGAGVGGGTDRRVERIYIQYASTQGRFFEGARHRIRKSRKNLGQFVPKKSSSQQIQGVVPPLTDEGSAREGAGRPKTEPVKNKRKA